jgi:uncharacterized repeat protein (TIGR01451 family)
LALLLLRNNGVGKSMELMNISHIIMKKIIQNISVVMVISALLVSAFVTPQTVIASTGGEIGGFPSFDFPGFGFPGFDFPDFDFPNPTVTSCEVTANLQEVAFGGSVTLSWNTTGFNTVRINGQSYSGETGSVVMTNIQANTTYTLSATSADGNSNCTATVSVLCIPTPPVHECRLDLRKSVDKATANVGDTLTYTIEVENTGNGNCSGSGVKIEDLVNTNLTFLTQSVSSNLTAGYGTAPVYTSSDRTLRFNGDTLTPGEKGTITWTGKVTAPSTCGDFSVPNQAKAYAYELNNFQTAVNSNTVTTQVNNDCPVANPAPLCDSFTATPGTITVGGTAQLAWQTSHATRVAINNGIGEVAVDGTISVSPIANTTYILTVFGTDNRTVNCQVPVVVSATPVPVCEFFTATPNSFTNGGGQVTLNWKLNSVSVATISPTIGTVATVGSRTIAVTSNTTFVLTGTDQTNNRQVSCSVPVTVSTPTPVFSCQNNVSFTSSDSRIDEGGDTTLIWSSSNVDSLTISEINATALSGSRTVDPRRTTTYVLTARKGTESVNCPLTITVDEDSGGGGGGGGGSVTPRCELTISDNQIRSGEQITLRWETSNATEMTIKDDRRNTVATTEDKLSRDKKDFLDGSIRLRPTRDTEYTLVAERGSRDRTCKVSVDVDDLTVLTNRDQQPLVAGISLSNVPYTGFEAGPVLTLTFYVLLLAWALFVAYVLVLRRQPKTEAVHITETASGVSVMQKAEAIRPDVFVQSTFMAPVAASTAMLPTNLPTGTPMIGYGNHSAVSINPHQVSDEVITTLENRAHKQMALLSSDAIAYFIATTEGVLERNESLDQVISEAKTTYPLEDGWIVINESRMRGLCDVCVVNQTLAQTEIFEPSVMPVGSSSLAEAIITGNVIAAYEMIGNRPMFALADAAADFDAVYRNRTGAGLFVSDMLTTEAAKLSDEKIKNVIAALTGAIDGTYTDESSAVKMAIMKAVKEVA